MASMMTIPTEIRLKIWRFVIPEEVKTDILRKSYLSSTHDYEDVPLPANPVVPLLLSCHRFRAEVTMVTKPLLTAVSSGVMLDFELSCAQDKIKAFDRIKVCGRFHYPPTENVTSELFWKQSDVASIIKKYYSTVEKVYLRAEMKGYLPNPTFPVPPGRVWYQYSMVFEVSGARPNEPGPA